MAFWYLAPQLGETFLRAARQRARFQFDGAGLWLGQSWSHPIRLWAYSDAAIEPDSLPLFLLGRHEQVPTKWRELLLEQQELLATFAGWVASLQPLLWEEVRRMATEPGFVIEAAGLRNLIEAAGLPKIIEAAGLSKVIQAAGLTKVIETAGLPKVLDAVGSEKLSAALGSEGLLELLRHLPPEQAQELLRRFQQPG